MPELSSAETQRNLEQAEGDQKREEAEQVVEALTPATSNDDDSAGQWTHHGKKLQRKGDGRQQNSRREPL